jgi:hypothetical protein
MRTDILEIFQILNVNHKNLYIQTSSCNAAKSSSRCASLSLCLALLCPHTCTRLQNGRTQWLRNVSTYSFAWNRSYSYHTVPQYIHSNLMYKQYGTHRCTISEVWQQTSGGCALSNSQCVHRWVTEIQSCCCACTVCCTNTVLLRELQVVLVTDDAKWL